MAIDRETIGAVGAGRMGRGIALAFVFSGHSVLLIDAKPRSAADSDALAHDARSQIEGDLRFMAKLGAFAEADIPAALARVSVVPHAGSAAAIAACDVIFEGVPETLEAKAEAFAHIGAYARPDAIIASTTSTIGADMLAPLVVRPERFLNAHWLNPAHLMPLVELSPAPQTAPAVVTALRALLVRIGKVPIVCKASPGYIVPRIQALAMNEAARLVEEGVASAEDVDTAVRVGFGLRFAVLGLLEFIDWGGGDILFHASRFLSENIDPARFAAPAIIDANMHDKRRGLQDGAGFFDYAGMDVQAYREQRLEAFVAMLHHRDLMPVRGV